MKARRMGFSPCGSSESKARRLFPLVISSRSEVAGVERARNAGLDVKVIRKKDFPDLDQFSQHLVQEMDAAKADLVVQGGWLCLWKIPQTYENRVMNIHPALPCRREVQRHRPDRPARTLDRQ